MTKVVKIIDFGISKFPRAADESNATRFGTFWGSPDYASPEQTRGDPAIDRRSDLFSLGVIYYELLTGKKPFAGENVGQRQQSILNREPIPPAEANPAFPAAAAPIIERALQKDVADRYQSALEMLKEIRQAAVASGSAANKTLPYFEDKHSPERPPAEHGRNGVSADPGAPRGRRGEADGLPEDKGVRGGPSPLGARGIAVVVGLGILLCGLVVWILTGSFSPSRVLVVPIAADAGVDPESLESEVEEISLVHLESPPAPGEPAPSRRKARVQSAPEEDAGKGDAGAGEQVQNTETASSPVTPESPGSVPHPVAPEDSLTEREKQDAEYNRIAKKYIEFRWYNIRKCYRDRLAENPDLKGVVIMETVISARGIPIGFVVTKDTLKDSETIRCVENTIRKMFFPRPDSKRATIKNTFRFRPPSNFKPPPPKKKRKKSR